MNHRIAIEDSVKILKEHYIRILSPLAKKWSFKLVAFGKDIVTSDKSFGILTLAGHDELEPSPVSNHKDVRFKWLAGTLQAVFGKEVFVAPVLLTGEWVCFFFLEDFTMLRINRKYRHQILLEAFLADLQNVSLSSELGPEGQQHTHCR